MRTISKDGTEIAYSKTGKGPALITVDGAFGYRDNGGDRELSNILADHFTVYIYDRRGRGESGDTLPYSVERELEDLDALVKECAELPFICGFSSGCNLVVEAIKNGLKAKKIVLFEPPYVTVTQDEKNKRKEAKLKLENLISKGEKTKTVTYFLKNVVGVPVIFIFLFRLFNWSGWKKNESVAPTTIYDIEVMGDASVPEGLERKVTFPVLIIGGEKSPENLKAASKRAANAIPNAEILFLKGQDHSVSMKVIAPELIRFFKG